MSNVYILEPPTSGKVLLKTSVGDIDVELWAKETPKTCRNFIQLCLEGYYNGTIFHRVVKGFIAQGVIPMVMAQAESRFMEAHLRTSFIKDLDDPKLSSQTEEQIGKNDNTSEMNEDDDAESSESDPEERLEKIRQKLKSSKRPQKVRKPPVSISLSDYEEEDERSVQRKRK